MNFHQFHFPRRILTTKYRAILKFIRVFIAQEPLLGVFERLLKLLKVVKGF